MTFPNATPSTPLTIPGETYRPEGAGPFAAVVLLHGCEGVSPTSRRWARWFRDRGYVALVVDSWTPRGLTEACSFTVPDPPSTARLDDTLGALRYLQARPDVDRARVGVIGWSNGGVFSLSAVNGPTLERASARGVVLPSPGFAAAIGIYPGGCESLTPERVIRPVLILMGDADDWTPAHECVRMAEAMRGRGSDITVETFPGAYHYFDVRGMSKRVLPDVGNHTKPGGCCGATVAYDERALRTAERRIAEFFGYHLKPR
jgi:dienelactone hydrolase